jgi:hypothetical protein
VVVLRAKDGALVDLALGPEFFDHIGWGTVHLCDRRGARKVAARELRIVTGTRPALEVRGVDEALPALEVTTSYHVPPGKSQVVIDTKAVNTGNQALPDVEVCDELSLGNTRVQVPGRGEVRRSTTVRAPFSARTEAGLSYALAQRGGKDIEFTFDLLPPAGAFDPPIVARYGRTTVPPGGQVRVTRVLAVRRGAIHEAVEEALSGAGVALRRIALRLPRGMPPARVALQRDGIPFLITTGRAEVSLAVPAHGEYAAALVIPGAGAGPPSVIGRGAAAVELHPPPLGKMTLSVHDGKGRGLAAKVILKRRDGGAEVDFGNDGGTRVENVLYLPAEESEVVLAPGSYEVTATRGFQYGIAKATVRVERGQTHPVKLRLDRMVAAPGWISADLHVHGSSSFDSPVEAPARLVSALALGVDLLVATDHNGVTDYAAATGSEGLRGGVIVVPGQEVTTDGPAFGHFNVFPVARGRELRWIGRSPEQLFAEAKSVPGARPAIPPLIQVNHPRLQGIGYFDQMGLDTTTGRARNPSYREGYDLIEVFNGDHLSELGKVEQVVSDWFGLLNRGHRTVATGNSDSHRLPYQDVGYPRNFVLWKPNATRNDESRPRVEEVIAAIRAGRVVVSSGPFVHFTVAGQPVGSMVRSEGRAVLLHLAVEAPAWIDVSSVEVFENGKLMTSVKPSGRGVRRLDMTRQVAPRRDSWYVVMVRGRKPDPTQQRQGVLPFALTNPIWVDADGDGKFTPSAGPRVLKSSTERKMPLTVESFQSIKRFILEHGDRQTYCNMYNRNPHYRFRGFEVFLNPDVGQRNINCDPEHSDFDQMVIREESGEGRFLRVQVNPEGGGLKYQRQLEHLVTSRFEEMLQTIESRRGTDSGGQRR